MTEETRSLKPTDIIHDLVEVMAVASSGLPAEQNPPGGGAEAHLPNPGDTIYNLCDVMEEGRGITFLRQELMGEEVRAIVTDMVQRIAREMIPAIAERIIREEIEELKKEQEGEA